MGSYQARYKTPLWPSKRLSNRTLKVASPIITMSDADVNKAQGRRRLLVGPRATSCRTPELPDVLKAWNVWPLSSMALAMVVSALAVEVPEGPARLADVGSSRLLYQKNFILPLD